MRNYQMRSFFVLLLCIVSFNGVILQAQSGGNLADCKAWFFKSIKELPKNKNTFAQKYFQLPFLRGLSSDAHYSYDKISDHKELLFCVSTYFTDCLKDYKKTSKISFTEVLANDETLFNLNIRNEDPYDENGNIISQDTVRSFSGLINTNDQVFVITSACGPVYKIYDLPLSVTLYVIYNKDKKQYKYWAGVIGF